MYCKVYNKRKIKRLRIHSYFTARVPASFELQAPWKSGYRIKDTKRITSLMCRSSHPEMRIPGLSTLTWAGILSTRYAIAIIDCKTHRVTQALTRNAPLPAAQPSITQVRKMETRVLVVLTSPAGNCFSAWSLIHPQDCIFSNSVETYFQNISNQINLSSSIFKLLAWCVVNEVLFCVLS